jgi:hypothetical protein
MINQSFLTATPDPSGFTTTYTIAKPPDPVGFWVLYPGGYQTIKFAIYKRPTDEQIKNTEELLGWKWENYE